MQTCSHQVWASGEGEVREGLVEVHLERHGFWGHLSQGTISPTDKP